jgi:hypothetical protein
MTTMPVATMPVTTMPPTTMPEAAKRKREIRGAQRLATHVSRRVSGIQ